MRITRLVAFAAALILSACGEGFTDQKPPVLVATAALPGAGNAPLAVTPEETPQTLPGVAVSELSDRERRAWWRLVSTLYSPCPEHAVSIKQCVAESRSCAACKPAASLLAAKVHEGASMDQLRSIYALRFGPDVLKIDAADSPSRGPEDAPVTIIVWSDFECPHCRAAMPIIDRVMAKFPKQVRLVHKFYPLKQHLYAEGAARAAIAAQIQGRYWEMEHALFEHQSELTDPDIDKYAQGLQLDLKRLHSDSIDLRTTKIIERDRADADRAGLNGTPFVLVNGRQFDTTYFHLEPDLEPWISLELEIAARRK